MRHKHVASACDGINITSVKELQCDTRFVPAPQMIVHTGPASSSSGTPQVTPAPAHLTRKGGGQDQAGQDSEDRWCQVIVAIYPSNHMVVSIEREQISSHKRLDRERHNSHDRFEPAGASASNGGREHRRIPQRCLCRSAPFRTSTSERLQSLCRCPVML